MNLLLRPGLVGNSQFGISKFSHSLQRPPETRKDLSTLDFNLTLQEPLPFTSSRANRSTGGLDIDVPSASVDMITAQSIHSRRSLLLLRRRPLIFAAADSACCGLERYLLVVGGKNDSMNNLPRRYVELTILRTALKLICNSPRQQPKCLRRPACTVATSYGAFATPRCGYGGSDRLAFINSLRHKFVPNTCTTPIIVPRQITQLQHRPKLLY